MFCGDLNEKEIQGRGDICVHVTDLLCLTEETQHCKATVPQFKKKLFFTFHVNVHTFKQPVSYTCRIPNYITL